MKIKEIIVVEGKDDTIAIQRAVCADTIETNGSAINEMTIEKIKLAQRRRGVIIFTDPDYPGKRIRQIISAKVQGCKHAFLSKEEAIAKNGRGVGIEHASDESIRQALDMVYEETIMIREEISVDDLMEYGLIGGTDSASRRERLGKLLHIGHTNGKQLHKRLQMFQITKNQLNEAIFLMEERNE